MVGHPETVIRDNRSELGQCISFVGREHGGMELGTVVRM
jgi:hypothetical protein